jgi:hypothetical protein
MVSKKTVKVAGFVGALCASAALVATAATSTGAYFTNSKDGNLAGSAGHLEVLTSGTNINFTGLNPGEDQTQKITYTPTSNSTTKEDIWLVFDPNTTGYGAFTGAKGLTYGSWTSGGLGGYGHFKIISDQGLGFQSYNLALDPSGNNTCANANGDGGSTAKETLASDGHTIVPAPYCGVPAAIKIGSGLNPGQASNAYLTFGLTGKATTQDITWANVPFKIVATQPGIRPDAVSY